jgi:hypothetical protein
VRNFGKLLATLANPIASPLTIHHAARSLRVSPRLSDIRLREDLKLCSRFPRRLNRLRKNPILARRAKSPGLKPFETIGLIQGAEAPCSLPKVKTGVFPQPVKPRCNGYAYGGTEVPPFQNGNALGQNGNAYDGTEVPPYQNRDLLTIFRSS